MSSSERVEASVAWNVGIFRETWWQFCFLDKNDIWLVVMGEEREFGDFGS